MNRSASWGLSPAIGRAVASEGRATFPLGPVSFGARARSRTGMTLRSRDFKSLASTDFATRARAKHRRVAGARPEREPGLAEIRAEIRHWYWSTRVSQMLGPPH